MSRTVDQVHIPSRSSGRPCTGLPSPLRPATGGRHAAPDPAGVTVSPTATPLEGAGQAAHEPRHRRGDQPSRARHAPRHASLTAPEDPSSRPVRSSASGSHGNQPGKDSAPGRSRHAHSHPSAHPGNPSSAHQSGNPSGEAPTGRAASSQGEHRAAHPGWVRRKSKAAGGPTIGRKPDVSPASYRESRSCRHEASHESWRTRRCTPASIRPPRWSLRVTACRKTSPAPRLPVRPGPRAPSGSPGAAHGAPAPAAERDGPGRSPRCALHWAVPERGGRCRRGPHHGGSKAIAECTAMVRSALAPPGRPGPARRTAGAPTPR